MERDRGMEMNADCQKICLGHAYAHPAAGDDGASLVMLLRILRGESMLEPRAPVSPRVVSRAEHMLRVEERPIYTFSGCLHPKLGTIGLIIAPACIPRCVQGVSRCDSGGLVGRIGAFEYVEPEEVEKALASLSFDGVDLKWRVAFSDELVQSYAAPNRYVAGDVPDHTSWSDVRAHCLTRHEANEDETPDRRLWTWEVRLKLAPHVSEYLAVVLSPEAFKRLEHLQRSGETCPESIRVVGGYISDAGVHYFDDVRVVALLCGAEPR